MRKPSISPISITEILLVIVAFVAHFFLGAGLLIIGMMAQIGTHAHPPFWPFWLTVAVISIAITAIFAFAYYVKDTVFTVALLGGSFIATVLLISGGWYIASM